MLIKTKTNAQRVQDLQDLVFQYVQEGPIKEDLIYYLQMLKNKYIRQMQYSYNRRKKEKIKKEEKIFEILPCLNLEYQTIEQIYLKCKRRGLENMTQKRIIARLNKLVNLGLVEKKTIYLKRKLKRIYRLYTQEEIKQNAEQEILKEMQEAENK